MRTILLTGSNQLALELVSHYSLLSNYVFYHYLSSHNVVDMIDVDLELTKSVDREVMIVVVYHNECLLEYVTNYYKNKPIEVEVLDE